MSVRVTERWSNRRLFRRADGSRGARRGFDVTGVNDEDDARNAIDDITGLAVPLVGDLHPLGGEMRVAGIDVERRSAGRHFRVSAEYDRETTAGSDSSSGSDDPLDEPPTWDWRFGQQQATVDRDANGNPILMSNLQPPASGVTEESPTFALVLVKNQPLFDPSQAKDFHLAINTDQLIIAGQNIAAPGTARLRGMRPTGPIDLTESFVPVAYEFVFREPEAGQPAGASPFFHRLRDEGTVVRVSDHPKDTESDQVPVALYDADQQQASEPVLLDGEGKPLNDKWQAGLSDYTIVSQGLPPGAILEDGKDAKYLWYRGKFMKARQFSNLGLS